MATFTAYSRALMNVNIVGQTAGQAASISLIPDGVNGAWTTNGITDGVDITGFGLGNDKGVLVGDRTILLCYHLHLTAPASITLKDDAGDNHTCNVDADSFARIGTTDIAVAHLTADAPAGCTRHKLAPSNFSDMWYHNAASLPLAFKNNRQLQTGIVSINYATSFIAWDTDTEFADWVTPESDPDESGALFWISVDGEAVPIAHVFNTMGGPCYSDYNAQIAALAYPPDTVGGLCTAMPTAAFSFPVVEQVMWTMTGSKIGTTLDNTRAARVLAWVGSSLFTVVYDESTAKPIQKIDPTNGSISSSTAISPISNTSIASIGSVQLPIDTLDATTGATVNANTPVIAYSQLIGDGAGYSQLANPTGVAFGNALESTPGAGDGYWGESDALIPVVGNTMLDGDLLTLTDSGSVSGLQIYGTAFPTLGANGAASNGQEYAISGSLSGLTTMGSYVISGLAMETGKVKVFGFPNYALSDDHDITITGVTGTVYSISYRDDTGTALRYNAVVQQAESTELWGITATPPLLPDLALEVSGADLVGTFTAVDDTSAYAYSLDGGTTYETAFTGNTFTLTGASANGYASIVVRGYFDTAATLITCQTITSQIIQSSPTLAVDGDDLTLTWTAAANADSSVLLVNGSSVTPTQPVTITGGANANTIVSYTDYDASDNVIGYGETAYIGAPAGQSSLYRRMRRERMANELRRRISGA